MTRTFVAAIAAVGLVAPALNADQEKPPASKSPASIASSRGRKFTRVDLRNCAGPESGGSSGSRRRREREQLPA